jgi:hypothetical protein
VSRFTVQRYCTKNDQNGNPRRVFVIRDEHGTIVATADEGYEGRSVVGPALLALGLDEAMALHLDRREPSWWARHLDVTDLGDVDVSPGVYRRTKGYRVPKP